MREDLDADVVDLIVRAEAGHLRRIRSRLRQHTYIRPLLRPVSSISQDIALTAPPWNGRTTIALTRAQRSDMSEERRNPVQWQLTGAAGAIRSGQAYGLKNNEDGKSIAYGARDTGINLVWDGKNAGGNITLVRASGVKDAIKHGDFVALQVKGGQFLRYQKRTVAVNLGWSDAPVEEWQLIGGKLGDPVIMGQPFALRSKIEDDLLVYAVREFGINLRWDKDYKLIGDKSWITTILESGVDAAVKFAEAKGVPAAVTNRAGGVLKEQLVARVSERAEK